MSKSKKLINFRNFIISALIHFAIIFTMLILITTISGAIVGSNVISGISSWSIIILVSLVLSIIFYFIFKINKITLFLQITIIYFLVAIAVYLVCFYLIPGLFNFSNQENVMFFLSSFAITLTGYGIIAMIIIIKTKRENDRLNKSLNSFKERDK